MSEATTACTRCTSPLERGDLRCAICGLPCPKQATPDQDDGFAVPPPTDVVASVMRCHGCGAAVAYDVKVAAPKCAFCGSVTELETPEDPLEQAQAFLCFRVEPEQAKAALRQWMSGLGWFRPPDLRDAECRALAAGYNLGDRMDAPDEGRRARVEAFDVQRSAARATIGRALANTAAAHASHHVPGSTRRNLKVAVLPQRMTTERLGFPAYVLAYRYQDAVYRAIVHGQDPNFVVGKAPWSWTRIAMIVVAAVVGILAVAGIVWLASRR